MKNYIRRWRKRSKRFSSIGVVPTRPTRPWVTAKSCIERILTVHASCITECEKVLEKPQCQQDGSRYVQPVKRSKVEITKPHKAFTFVQVLYGTFLTELYVALLNL